MEKRINKVAILHQNIRKREILFFTWSCHIRGSRWFDFFNATKCFFLKDLVKICDDFIQEPKALHTFVVCFQLDIKFAKVWNWGENYADARTLFVVQILKKGNCMISQHKSQIQKKKKSQFFFLVAGNE